jgi:hypothetical protein
MLYLLATQPALAMKLATLFLSVVRMLAQPAKLRTLGESVLQWL